MPSALEDGSALRAPPTAQRLPSYMEEGSAPSALEDGSALAQRVPSDMEEGCGTSVLEDGSALRAPPTALRAPSDMEEGCAPLALEDGSALRALPTALALAFGVGSVLEEREGDKDGPTKHANKPRWCTIWSTANKTTFGRVCKFAHCAEWREEVLANMQGPTTPGPTAR